MYSIISHQKASGLILSEMGGCWHVLNDTIRLTLQRALLATMLSIEHQGTRMTVNAMLSIEHQGSRISSECHVQYRAPGVKDHCGCYVEYQI